jgi:hypothetical protein
VKLYHTDYALTLRVTTRDGDPPPEVVLRAALKALLRSHGCRCVALREAAGPTPTASPGTPGAVGAARGADGPADAAGSLLDAREG